MRQAATALLIFSLAACGGPARLPLEAAIGANPQLPPPEQALIPAAKFQGKRLACRNHAGCCSRLEGQRLLIAHGGSILIADDVGNTIWRVTAATP